MIGSSTRRAAGVVAALVVGAVLASSAPAVATSTFTFTRLSGGDRYDTARRIAVDTFDAARTVVLATGENFPDALAGSYLAGDVGGPILLTQRTAVPARTSEALVALGAGTILLLGGTGAISEEVERDLRSRGFGVTRIQGADRYDTALAVASRPGADNVGTVDGKRTALLASGERFPDALAAGPLSFKAGLPILLTESAALSPEARQGIEDLDVQHVVILGGTGAVSAKVQEDVVAIQGVTVQRIAGADRTETGTLLADFALEKLGFSDEHVNLARGDDAGLGTDALAGGPHAGDDAAPILLAATPTALDSPIGANRKWLQGRQATLTSGHVFGGFGAVSPAVENAARQAAGVNPPTAPAGTSTPTVSSVNLTEDYFISSASTTYYFDSGDTFQLRGDPRTKAEFEGLLNPDDSLTVNFDPNASGVSTFNITDDVTHAPGKPGATAKNLNGDQGASANDVQITVSLPTDNGSGTLYVLQRAAYQFPNCQAPANNLGAFADLAGADLSDGAHDDLDVANGCYVYRVQARPPAGGTVATSPNTDNVAVPGPADTRQPRITDARATTDGGTSGVVDAGDKHTLTFDETMSEASETGSYTLSDADGTVVVVTCGTGVTCDINNNNFTRTFPPSPFGVLTVTITGELQTSSEGGTAGLQYPGTITNTTGIRDNAGNNVSLAGSDVTINK